MRTASVFAVLSSFAALAAAATLQPQAAQKSLTVSQMVKVPKDDPFWIPPEGFESTKPGTILRYRSIPGHLSLNNKDPINIQNATQILYRTVNSVGEPEATVVTVIVPYNAHRDKLFVYHFFTDAAYSGCTPSLAIQAGVREDAGFTQLENMIAIIGLTRGWIVSIADSMGPQAAFGSGLGEGLATLDSIRAVKQSGFLTGISPDPLINTYGYSTGGVAAGFTTELAPTYAPDIKIAGSALGGLLPNISTLANFFNKNYRAAFIPAFLLGMAHDYKNMSDWLDENLKPEHAAEFRMADQHCFDSNLNYSFIDHNRYFKRGLESLTDPVPWSVINLAGTMGVRGVPQTPWYLQETVSDDASPVELTDQLYDKFCKLGVDITYERNPIPLNHTYEALWAMPGAFTWLEDRFAGKPIKKGCRTTVFTEESIRSVQSGLLFKGIFENLLAYMGRPIGP